MSGGSGGSGSGGRSGGGGSTNGDAGQPGEVFREANKANSRDNGITAALRDVYEPHRVNVSQANGRTIMEHTNGRIEIYDSGTKAVVQKPGGKRYNYNNVIKALGHFEDLGGFKT